MGFCLFLLVEDSIVFPWKLWVPSPDEPQSVSDPEAVPGPSRCLGYNPGIDRRIADFNPFVSTASGKPENVLLCWVAVGPSQKSVSLFVNTDNPSCFNKNMFSAKMHSQTDIKNTHMGLSFWRVALSSPLVRLVFRRNQQAQTPSLFLARVYFCF